MAQEQDDTCPISMTGEHRYFVFKTADVFEPYNPTDVAGDIESVNWYINNKTLYEKKEYATLGCNCGSAIKTEVKQK